MSRQLTDESSEAALLNLAFMAPKHLDSPLCKPGLVTGINRELLKAMLQLRLGGKPVTPANVRLLTKDEKLGELADKLNVRPLGGSFELLVERLREVRIRSRLADACSKFHERAYDEKEPIRQIVEDFESAAMGMRALKADNQHLGSDYSDVIAEIEWKNANPGKIRGLSTGWPKVDRLINGLQGQYYVLGARTSVGKTSLVLDLCATLCDGGHRVVYFAGEDAHQIKKRMLAITARVPMGYMERAYTPEENKMMMRAISQIQKWDWIIDDTANPSISHIRGTARRLHQERKVTMVVVDYIQICTSGAVRRDDKRAIIEDVSLGFKAAVKDHDFQTAFVVLSQLKRKEGIFDHKTKSKEAQRPELIDLKEAGAIEEHADTVFLLHRDQANSSTRAELNVAKNKDGKTEMVFMEFNPEVYYFSES